MTQYARELEIERTMRDRFMSGHAESPFVAERVTGFTQLRYFPIDEAYRVPAVLERLETPREEYLRTNRDGQSLVRHVGDLVFTLQGRALRLRVYHAGEGVGTSVFVPFRDLTSGRESYGPGRYLTVELTPDDAYELDFNRAFNPYCAYTDAYECGFPPAQNDLPVAVRAGEKAWSSERNPRTPSSAVLALLTRGQSASGGHRQGSKRRATRTATGRQRSAAPRGGARRSRAATSRGAPSR